MGSAACISALCLSSIASVSNSSSQTSHFNSALLLWVGVSHEAPSPFGPAPQLSNVLEAPATETGYAGGLSCRLRCSRSVSSRTAASTRSHSRQSASDLQTWSSSDSHCVRRSGTSLRDRSPFPLSIFVITPTAKTFTSNCAATTYAVNFLVRKSVPEALALVPHRCRRGIQANVLGDGTRRGRRRRRVGRHCPQLESPALLHGREERDGLAVGREGR